MSWMLRGTAIGITPVIFYMALALKQKDKRAVAGFFLLLLVIGLLLLRMGQRGMLFGALFAGLVMFHYMWKRISLMPFLAALIVGATLNSMMLTWRSDYVKSDVSIEDAALRPTASLASHEMDRKRFSTLAALINHFPNQKDYLLGESWLGIVAAPIPRWVWPGKVEAFKWRDTNIMQNIAGAAIPSPYLGALYVNFSWLGILLGMVFWGGVQRGQYEWFRRAPNDPAQVLMFFSLFMISGPTLFTLLQIAQTGGVTWLMLRYIRGGRPRIQQGAT